LDEILNIYAKAPKGAELAKAFQDGTYKKLNTNAVKANEPKSAIIDPYGIYNVEGLKQKSFGVPFFTLRRMAQVPAIAAVINTRLNQIARFTRRPRFEADIGFKVSLKDSNAKISEAGKKKAFDIEEFFLKTGAVPNSRRKDNFDSFIRKVVRDTLTIDAMVWENVANIKGGLAEIWAVDGATIEIVADSPVGEGSIIPVYAPVTKRGRTDEGSIAYVQKIDGRAVAEYTEAELCYAIRNPRTDIYATDFGMSELETLIEIVTGIVNGVRYNTAYFSENHLPQGVLEFIGKYKDEHLEAFKRHWKTLTDGAAGKWAVPVMASQEGNGFKFTSFKNNNRDMEFNEFLEFLFNITCAVYQIDPNEVGFKSWTSGSGSPMRSDNTEVKIDESKDKGFIPLMQFLANTFNSEVVDQIDPDFAFSWVGVDEEDEAAKLEHDKTLLEMGKFTVAELRKRDDMDEILDEDGKPAKWTQAPANSALIQVYMAGLQAEQAQQQQGQQQTQQAQESAQNKIDSDGEHQKQLEVMDKEHQHKMEETELQHKHDMEAKKSDQEHQVNLEKYKAQQAAKQQSSKKDQNLKKSMDASEDLEIEITWKEY
jgi:hypothetical protein